MSSFLQAPTLSDRFEHVFRVVSGERFIKREGLGNEAPFFICPYDPHEAEEAECEISHLKSRLRNEKGINAICVDLYELSLDILRRREPGFLESIIKNFLVLAVGFTIRLNQHEDIVDIDFHLPDQFGFKHDIVGDVFLLPFLAFGFQVDISALVVLKIRFRQDFLSFEVIERRQDIANSKYRAEQAEEKLLLLFPHNGPVQGKVCQKLLNHLLTHEDII